MNNVEKNLNEVCLEFFYDSSIKEVLTALNANFANILAKGKKANMTMNEEEERELIHRLLIEGVTFFLHSKLKKRLVEYSSKISEAPLLLANPATVEDKSKLEVLHPNMIQSILNQITAY